MKKLLFSFLLFTVCLKAQEEVPSIDVLQGMTLGDGSESAKEVNEILNSGQQSPLSSTLSESMKEVSEHSYSSFSSVYEATPKRAMPTSVWNDNDNDNRNVSSSAAPLRPDEKPLFVGDNSESWNQEIDLDDYYDRQPNGSYVKKGIAKKNENNSLLLYGIIFILGAVVLFLLLNKGKEKKGELKSK
jgi:hypothetical protein